MAKAVGARCPVLTAQERFRKRARAELTRRRMKVSEVEFVSLIADYSRISHRLAANGDVIGRDWPARVAILAAVVLDARNRVEIAEMGST